MRTGSGIDLGLGGPEFTKAKYHVSALNKELTFRSNGGRFYLRYTQTLQKLAIRSYVP